MIHLIHFSIISCLSCHFIINQVFALVSHENSYSVGNHIKNRGTGVLFASQREDEWVLNPETNRLIKPDGPKWREFMCRSGGYIAFDNQLKAIDRKALWTWEQKNVSSTSEISTDHLRNMNTLWNPLSPTSADLDNKVLEEDIETLPFLDQLLFVHKPSSLLTLPGIGSDKQVCLASLVNEWLESDSNDILSAAQASALRFGKKEKKKKKPFVTRPCHRLDYDTSGVLVIGLTRDSLRLTNAMFETSESPKLQKTYVALVAGHVERDTGFINYPIGKIYNAEKDCNEFACLMEDCKHPMKNSFVDKSLREARTKWTVLNRLSLPLGSEGNAAKYTRIRLKPLTGRGHQLRLHMAAIEHPILGDELHSPHNIAAATPRLCLHAESLEMVVRLADENNEDEKYYESKVCVTSIPPF